MTSCSAVVVGYLHLLVGSLFCLSAVGLQHRQGHGLYGPGSSRESHQNGLGSSLSSREALLFHTPFFEHEPYDPQSDHGGRNITTVEGGRAVLTCTIRHLGTNRTVSWIRKGRHPVVLSSGPHKFTSDRRVSITRPPRDPDSWQLVIDPVLEKDAALYECQVNTRDKMSLVFKLNVEAASAKLLGESAVYVKAGSTISLSCAINLYSVPPPDITWKHKNKVLNFDSPRGGISLETEKSRTGTHSKLLVTRAGTTDSGKYTCRPSRGEPISADVHVITDENPAELQDVPTGRGIQRLERILHLPFVLPVLVLLSVQLWQYL